MSAALPDVLDYPIAAPPAPGAVIEIAPRVLWLRMPLPFALDHINLWLLPESDGGCTLVDCGYGDLATRTVWESHIATTLRSMPIRRIIATHFHPDHVGNAAWLSQRFAAPVAMTHAEYLTAHAAADEFGGYSMKATIELFRRHGLPEARGSCVREARQRVPPRRAGVAAIVRSHVGWRCAAGGEHDLADRRTATATRRSTRRSTPRSAAY